MERIEQQFRFIEEIDKMKQITRQTYLADGSRKENDAEHCWHLAMMTILLAEYANEPIDILKTVTMVLLHDVVEIDAGDTYAYDEEGKKTQRQREEKAADRLFSLLPEEQGKKFRDLWEEFEAKETAEAKFARAMDNIQPMMLNAASGAKAWREHGTKISMILKRNEITPKASETLWDFAKNEYLDKNIAAGNIIDDRQEQKKKILICDDSEINNKILKKYLEQNNFVVDVARNGKEAVEYFSKSTEGEYAIIFMDLHMPILGGIEATAKIRKLERSDAADVPIIAITVDIFDEETQECKKAGMNGSMSRPVVVETLEKLLKQYVFFRSDVPVLY